MVDKNFLLFFHLCSFSVTAKAGLFFISPIFIQSLIRVLGSIVHCFLRALASFHHSLKLACKVLKNIASSRSYLKRTVFISVFSYNSFHLRISLVLLTLCQRSAGSNLVVLCHELGSCDVLDQLHAKFRIFRL